MGVVGTFHEALATSPFQSEGRESGFFLDMGSFFFLHTTLMETTLCVGKLQGGDLPHHAVP